jgi:hypothetical protein
MREVHTEFFFRVFEKHRCRWEHDIEIDLQEIGWKYVD